MKNTLFLLLAFVSLITAAQNPNDCVNAILICGNTPIGVTPSGVGINEFANGVNIPPPCYDFNGPQAWFTVSFDSAGTFTFDLIPDIPLADYDFAIFGPNTTCDNLGPSIRCSSTNPRAAGVSGATGLNTTETDVNEGPGPQGNGYLQQLTVQAGETYFIIVGLAEGTGGFSFNSGGTASLPPAAIAGPVDDFQVCDELGPVDGRTTFDLSFLDDQIIGAQPNVQLTYHTSLNDANIGSNPITFPFENTANPVTFYARVLRLDSECFAIESFTVQVDNVPVNTNLPDTIICSTNATETFDFATVINDYIPTASARQVSYHNSLADAQNVANLQSSVFTATTTPQTVFISVVDPTGTTCPYVANTDLVITPPPQLAAPDPLIVCDISNNRTETVDLTLRNSDIVNGLPVTAFNFSYYRTAANRSSSTNALPTTYTLNNTSELIFVRVTDIATGCFSDIQLPIQLTPEPVLDQQESLFVCLEATTPYVIGVPQGFTSYLWDTGETSSTIEITAPGDYTVTVTNAAGCAQITTITALPSNVAVITNILTNDFNRGNNSATAVVTGSGNYEYSIDGFTYQDAPTFLNLDEVYYTLRVRDKNGCGIARQDFVVLDYPPVFTPNNDGFNDFWKIEGLETLENPQLFIFDRFGKLIKQSSAVGPGFDGTFNGAPLPSDTYWFTLKVTGRRDIKGYFALKR